MAVSLLGLSLECDVAGVGQDGHDISIGSI